MSLVLTILGGRRLTGKYVEGLEVRIATVMFVIGGQSLIPTYTLVGR